MRTARLALLVGLTVGLLVPVTPAMADHYIVNTARDEADASPANSTCDTSTANVCTLRAAVQSANSSSGDDTIDVLGQPISLDVGGPGEDASAEGDLDITQIGTTVTMNGDPAGGTVVLNIEGIYRIFDVKSGATLN